MNWNAALFIKIYRREWFPQFLLFPLGNEMIRLSQECFWSSATKGMRWPGDCSSLSPDLNLGASATFFCLTYPTSNSIPTLSHNWFYSFSVIGHKPTLSLILTHLPRHTHTHIHTHTHTPNYTEEKARWAQPYLEVPSNIFFNFLFSQLL